MTNENTQALSAGQKAAATRAANKAANGGLTLVSKPGALAKKAQEMASARLSGLVLDMVISVGDRWLEIAFRAKNEKGEPFASGLATNERALPDVRWMGQLHAETYEVEAHGGCFARLLASVHEYAAQSRPAAYVLELGQLMSRLDATVKQAVEDSDDGSFAYVASQLASIFRVNAVVVKDAKGETAHKRGAAYITVLRLCDTLTAAAKAKAAAEAKAKALAAKKAA